MAPVEKNKIYTLSIDDITSDGNGVGRIEGFAVFVPGTVPGDIIKVLIVKVNKGYGYGKAKEFLKKSDDRVVTECHEYERCGGCQLSHLNYDSQINLKKSFIENAMRRIGGFKDFEVSEMIPMKNPSRYRNKMVFPIGRDKNGTVVCGFYAPRSHRIIPIDDCLICNEVSGKIIGSVMEYIKENNISPYDEESHSGLIRRLFIRTARVTGEIMAVISINGDRIPKEKALLEKLSGIDSVILNVNKKRTNLVLGDKNVVLKGKGYIEDYLCGIRFKISPNSFFQVNPEQTELLYDKALEYAGLTGKERVMDIYCGIGTISLCAAKKAAEVIGVEIVPQAIEDAKKNAVENEIENARFYAADASEIVPELIKMGERPDVVIMDPPRKGSDENTLRAVIEAAPERIVYVSCNPATLARDVAFLAEYGYMPVKAAGADMFPHTVHVETIVLLQRETL